MISDHLTWNLYGIIILKFFFLLNAWKSPKKNTRFHQGKSYSKCQFQHCYKQSTNNAANTHTNIHMYMHQTWESLDDGVVPWVWQVLQEVLKWTLSSHIVLNHKPQECQHCQSPRKHTHQVKLCHIIVCFTVIMFSDYSCLPLASFFSMASSVISKLSGLNGPTGKDAEVLYLGNGYFRIPFSIKTWKYLKINQDFTVESRDNKRVTCIMLPRSVCRLF